tara:strand:+ start:284 stop:547 length:264 start_codon:yes stop_codon:yes gene_type:complete
MNLNKQNLINKIIYRSLYRGSKEMDLFVSSFVKSIIYDLDLSDLQNLNNLINLNDEDIIKISNNQFNKNNFKMSRIVDLLLRFKQKY